MKSSPAIRPTIVFDGDDTLWETQGLYDAAKERFYDVLEQFGHDRTDVSKKFAEVDVSNVAVMGFSPERFPRSMRETYEFYCVSRGETADEGVGARIETIARAVFTQPTELRSDAAYVLGDLRSRFRLILFTAGDEIVQRRRIQETRVAAMVDEIVVVPLKNAESWESLVSMFKFTPGDSWSVGNSVRSDINPALKLGLRSVLVTGNSWEYERMAVIEGQHGLRPWHATTLRQARRIILEESGGALSAPITGEGAGDH